MTIQSETDYTQIPLVFNVYKPKGISSFQVVYHFKKNLNFDFGKIGHFGTLDPFAEGVLLIGIQGAQKMNDYVHKYLPKTYEAVGIFGDKTFSGDLSAPSIEHKDIDLNFQKLELHEMEAKILEKFIGEYWQSPHAVSAAKFEGKRLYQHALEGRTITKEKVKREIISFKLLSYNYPEMRFLVCVSSGTYVRSFFEEIASFFNGVGALKDLKRTAVGNLTSEMSLVQENWPIKNNSFDLKIHGQTLDILFPLRGVVISNKEASHYLQGQTLGFNDLIKIENENEVHSQNLAWVYSETKYLLGLAKIEEDKLLAVFNLKEAIALFCSTS